MTDDILKLSMTECAAAIKAKKFTATEAVRASLNRIEKCKKLNNFITVCADEALEAAKITDKKIAAGIDAGVLAGVPIAIKDNISTKGVRTTCASKALENYVPFFDASVITALKNSGAVIMGKTNLDEFAMGSGCEYSAFGAAKNFHDNTKVAGGSSGGSANAVASGEVFAALGSDTGGSIRQPAAYCGVMGFKPTYSVVSRYGALAYASSLDQIGTLTRTASDAAVLMDIIGFYDEKDSTSSKKFYAQNDVNFTGFKTQLKGKKFGVPKEFFSDALNSGVKASIEGAMHSLEEQGASLVETSIKSFGAALATYYVLSSAEAASNLARFDGIKYGFRAEADNIGDVYYNSRTQGFGDEVKRRIITGNYVLSSGYYDAYYLKACRVRTLIRDEFLMALDNCDALICPAAPGTAYKIGEKHKDPSQAYLSDIYTVPVNIAGLPAVSVPCGKSERMPVGMQFIGKAYDDRMVLAIAKAYEKECLK